MYQILIVFQVLVGLGVIGLVLMQQGKGADAGAAFGSGASGTVFGAQGSASFLSRATAILALLFFLSSLGLAILIGNRDEAKDLMDVPEVNQNFTDVPFVSESSEPVSVPSISQQQRVEKSPEVVEVIEAVEGTPEIVEVTEVIEEEPVPEVEETVESSSSEIIPEVEEKPAGN